MVLIKDNRTVLNICTEIFNDQTMLSHAENLT